MNNNRSEYNRNYYIKNRERIIQKSFRILSSKQRNDKPEKQRLLC
jgi:hypothetical protein